MTGYCPVCRMIVDTDRWNVLRAHGVRYTSSGMWGNRCIGSGCEASPMPDTPEVEEAAFSDDRREAHCSKCTNPNAVNKTDYGGRIYMNAHLPPGGVEGSPLCPGSWEPPAYG